MTVRVLFGAMLRSCIAIALLADFCPVGPALASSPDALVSLSPTRPLPLVMFAQAAAADNAKPSGIPNPARLSLQMLPEKTADVGTKVSFRVTAKRPGYLLLLDIDATGKMSQIFPSPEMIVQSEEAAMNFLKPGDELIIPNAAAKKNGFEYVITPPTGQAAVVAILSERRVQILDLPDDAQRPRPDSEIIGDLAKWTSALRIPDPATGKLMPSAWSFDIRSYAIR